MKEWDESGKLLSDDDILKDGSRKSRGNAISLPIKIYVDKKWVVSPGAG